MVKLFKNNRSPGRHRCDNRLCLRKTLSTLPWSGTPTVDEIPYTTTLWDPLDPYGFSALKYALHY